MKTFTHVSTAYVNSDKQGKIDEKIYDLPNNKDSEKLAVSDLEVSSFSVFDHRLESDPFPHHRPFLGHSLVLRVE